MRRIVASVILIIIGFYCGALEMEDYIIETYESCKISHWFYNTDDILISKAYYQTSEKKYGVLIADWDTGEIKFDGNSPVLPVGMIDNNLIIADYYSSKLEFGGFEGNPYDVHLYNLNTGTLEKAEWSDYLIYDINWVYSILYEYQNGQFFTQHNTMDEERESKINLYDIVNQTSTVVYNEEELRGITRDKMHLLINDFGYIHFWNIETKEKYPDIKRMGMTYTGKNFHQQRCGLINNTLAYGVDSDDETQWKIAHVEKGLIGSYPFTFNGQPIHYLVISPDATRAICMPVGSSNTYVVDITEFHDWLDNQGLLFHKTTGVLNDNRVRMREYPNLEAKTLGYLNTGDKVEVLDRSGIKKQIGSMNDYWYKVKTEEGVEGWAYGYFINNGQSPIIRNDIRQIMQE